MMTGAPGVRSLIFVAMCCFSETVAFAARAVSFANFFLRCLRRLISLRRSLQPKGHLLMMRSTIEYDAVTFSPYGTGAVRGVNTPRILRKI